MLVSIPRTGLLGTLLLAAYLGGVIATHLEHQQPFTFSSDYRVFVLDHGSDTLPESSIRLSGRISKNS